MSIVRSSIIVNEEFLGYIQARRDHGNVSIIMNPTTLMTMGEHVRAVTTIDGNTFYANTTSNYDILHKDIINWMIANGYLSGSYFDFVIKNGWNNLVCWQRDGDEMLLSESYYFEGRDTKEWKNILDIFDKMDKKEITYKLKQIYE